LRPHTLPKSNISGLLIKMTPIPLWFR
jgi:hypothetical protein